MSSVLNSSMVEIDPEKQVFTTRLATRNLPPQNSTISGMKGRWSRDPSASSVRRISSGALTSARSPANSLASGSIMSSSSACVQLTSEFSSCEERGEHQRGFGHQPYDQKKLVPGEHPDSKRPRHGVSEERDLSDVLRDTPCAGGSGREEYDVSRAEPPFLAFLIRNEGLAGDHDKSLVLVVVPVEKPGSAIPDHNVRGAVMASRQFLASRFGGAVKNPLRADRGGLEVGGGCGRNHKRFGHGHPPNVVVE